MTTWTWQYEGVDGLPLEDPALPRTSFPTQADAESWVGEEWEELLGLGVEQVTLLEGDRVVYRAMSLRPNV